MWPALALAIALEGSPAVRWRAHEVWALAVEPPRAAWTPPAAWTGRVWTTPKLHIGVRSHWMATSDEAAGAVTLQITWGGAL